MTVMASLSLCPRKPRSYGVRLVWHPTRSPSSRLFIHAHGSAIQEHHSALYAPHWPNNRPTDCTKERALNKYWTIWRYTLRWYPWKWRKKYKVDLYRHSRIKVICNSFPISVYTCEGRRKVYPRCVSWLCNMMLGLTNADYFCMVVYITE